MYIGRLWRRRVLEGAQQSTNPRYAELVERLVLRRAFRLEFEDEVSGVSEWLQYDILNPAP